MLTLGKNIVFADMGNEKRLVTYANTREIAANLLASVVSGFAALFVFSFDGKAFV